MRYFIHLGFDGSTFSGWQRQKATSNTIQEVIEHTLNKLFKKPTPIYGCGRTDAGVHASQYVIQINLDEAPTFDLKFRMNKNLPNSIAVFEVLEITTDQHCRYDVTTRTYDYFVHWKKNPILSSNSSFYEDYSLDFNLMQKATALLSQTTDFRAFCKQPDLYDNTICCISHCGLSVNQSQGRLRFTITSNRFLRGMVRICVYYLLEVGRGKMTIETFKAILNQDKKLKTTYAAHPNGLFLSQITYPNLQLDDAHNLVTILRVGLD